MLQNQSPKKFLKLCQRQNFKLSIMSLTGFIFSLVPPIIKDAYFLYLVRGNLRELPELLLQKPPIQCPFEVVL